MRRPAKFSFQMKNTIRQLFAGTFAAFLLMASLPARATVVSELPVTSVGGKQCFYYDVKPKESIYSVANELGVTREQIVDFNPSAADGLKPRMRLYFPVEVFQVAPGERPAVYAAAAGITTHVVKKNESVYGIARKYGMSTDYLLRLNPWADEGVSEGQVLRITDDGQGDATAAATTAVAATSEAAPKPNAAGYIKHVIEPGETLFSISNANGAPLEAVLDANPTLDPLRYHAGQTLMIPVTSEAIARHSASDHALAAMQPGESAGVDAAESVEAMHIGQSETLAASGAADADRWLARDTMKVAVLLPFMLNEEPMSRTTQLYTEFFKGMLLAADTLRTDGLQPVKFSFYDTESSLERVRELLADPGVAQADLVIAPDNSAQIEAILSGVGPETLVLNIFAVKDESYLTHRNVVQTNIPHDAMYAKAIDAFVEKFADRLPVFISRSGGQADKDSFVAALKERLDADGISYREVTYSSILRDDDLQRLDPDAQPLVFVPVSGSKNEFARYSDALTTKRQSALAPGNVALWGYPEWVTFRGDSFDAICNLDATIYSRFLVDERDYRARDLKERYRSAYGVEMFDAVPTQGILGFDTGMFVVNGLRHKAETGAFPAEFSGIQNSLRLDWIGPETTAPAEAPATPESTASEGAAPAEGGLINHLLFLIHYSPGGFVESETL